MACKGCNEKTATIQAPRQTESVRSLNSDDFIRARLAVCALCSANDAGICKEQKTVRPDDDCDISVGVKMPRAYCPTGNWQRHDPSKYPARDKCSSCGTYWTATNETCNQCVVKLENKRRNVAKGIGTSDRFMANHNSGPRASAIKREMWDAVRNNPSRARRSSAFTALEGQTNFLTVNDLANDAMKLGQMLPHDVRAIVGVARSGMTPANIIATMLHLPLYAVRQTLGDVIAVGNGWRMGGHRHIDVAKQSKVAVIDDTSMTGNSFRAIDPILKREFAEYVTGAIYVNPLSNLKPDLYVHQLPWPHLLEWNLFNSVLSPNCATDFDGVICHDCQGWQDDDGKHYRTFIENAIPRYVSRKVPIPLIVTARIEKYREATEAWLRKHGIKWHRLVMHPAKSLRERNRDDIAAYKAKHFDDWARKHQPRPAPLMFIESDHNQSKRIHELTGRLVVCPSTAKVFGDPRNKRNS